MQRTEAHAVASKHGDKGLQLAACITTHMHSLPLDSTPPSQPLRRQAAPNGKRHKLRQNAFFTRQNESREQRKGEMQSQVVISDIGDQRDGRGGRVAGKEGGITPWSCSAAGKVNIKVHADEALRVNV